jgi:hypothetical protein
MINPDILEFKDKDASLSAVFIIRSFPQFTHDALNCISLKNKYDDSKEVSEKLISIKMFPPKIRSEIEIILEEHKKNWKKLSELSPQFSAYFLTHKRFLKKRAERLNSAYEGLIESDILKAKHLLIKLETSEKQIISLSLDPIKIMKKEIEQNDLKDKYLSQLLKLENKFLDISENLEECCPYLYRGLK